MYIFTSKLGALWFWYTSSIVAPRPSFTICCTICVCVCLYCAHTWRGYRSFRTRFSQNGQLIVVSQFNGMTWDNDLVVSAPQDNIFFSHSFFCLSFHSFQSTICSRLLLLRLLFLALAYSFTIHWSHHVVVVWFFLGGFFRVASRL